MRIKKLDKLREKIKGKSILRGGIIISMEMNDITDDEMNYLLFKKKK